MIATVTLKRYIKKCEIVLNNKDLKEAEKLQDEVIATLGNDIKGLKNGLSNYSFVSIASFAGHTTCLGEKVDFLGDLKIIKEKLIVELEKTEADLGNDMTISKKQNKIFVSHTPIESQEALAVIELLESIGLSEKDILSTSVSGYQVPINHNKYEYIAQEFENNNMFVIFLLSNNYYKSIASLNEMGATWILKNEYTSILLPGFTYKQITGAIDPCKVGIKLDDNIEEVNSRLNELKDLLIDLFNIPSVSTTKWERIRKTFLNKVSNNATKNNDIDNVLSKFMESGTDITIKTIISLGYDETKANNILEQLLKNNYIEKSRYGRYRWKNI